MPIHGYPGNIITANPTAPTVTSASGVWTTEQQLQAIAAGNWPGYEYPISRSLRFNSADSAYLNRTPGSASNRKTWTWSGWVKRCNSATTNSLFSAYVDANNFFLIQFRENADNGRFEVFNYSSAFDWRVETNALLRDPSAWYHIVVALDTTQATNSNRIKIYVNGTLQTLATTSYPTLDFQSDANNNIAHYIGQDGASGRYHNGYLTEINFVDGQALEPSSFGLNDPETGVWSPKRYTGTYGTNGFYLNFSDNSGTTSTTLGKDSSGNGNNWTPNNFSVTAGAGNDSLVDSPTAYGTDTGVGGEVRGNYATLNPLNIPKGGSMSNGNLDYTGPSAEGQAVGTMYASSGKWYWELVQSSGSGGCGFGIAKDTTNINSANLESGAYVYYSNGNKYNASTASSFGSSFTTGDVIGVALDLDSGKVWFAKNGTWQASGNPSGGTNEAFSGLSGNFTALIYDGTGAATPTYTANFGQRAFAYTAPSGFKALCTQNLPTPTIGATSTTQANAYMNAVLWTGNGSTQSITSVGFQPDLVWTKDRGAAFDHTWFDAVRGATKFLRSNSTSAEETQSDSLTSFNSNGFSVGADAVRNNINKSGASYVSWNWNAGGSTVTNTSGTISAQVRASTTSGFSIVTYTGNGSANQTVGHGLGVAPVFGILKDRDTNSNNNQWHVFATAYGDYYGYLSATNAFAATAEFYPTSGSSTTVTIGRSSPVANSNESGDNYVMYLFTPVAGYSAFGSYVGNGSTDGPFVYTGFRPEFVMIKSATTAGTSWEMFDNARETSNLMDLELLANSANAEGTYTFGDFVSNGFKLRSTNNGVNQSSATLIYMAFAESPFKYALAR